MKSLNDIKKEIGYVDTPFERKLRKIHEPELIDVPYAVQGDEDPTYVPKDNSHTDKEAVPGQEIGENIDTVLDPIDNIRDDQEVANLIDEIANLWSMFSTYELDEIAYQAIRGDLIDIRDWLASNITPEEGEELVHKQPVGTNSVRALPDFEPPMDDYQASGYSNDGPKAIHKWDSVFEDVDSFRPGSVKLPDGESFSITKQDADLLNNLKKALDPKNNKKLTQHVTKSEKSFREMIEFAKLATTGVKHETNN